MSDVRLSAEETSLLLQGFRIPPRQEMLAKLAKMLAQRDSSLEDLTALIVNDAGLASSVLKTVNSPLYGGNEKIASVGHALEILGRENLANLVAGLSIRTLSQDQPVKMERFMDTARDVARISAYLAGKIPGVRADDAFTLGLFHDCGMAVMIQRYPDYKGLLQKANKTSSASLLRMEEARFNTNHAVISYLVGRCWHLPEHICQVMLVHQDSDVFTRAGEKNYSEEVLTLTAILRMAIYFSHSNRHLEDANDWIAVRDDVMSYLGLTEAEFSDLEADVKEKAISGELTDWSNRAGSRS
ncbi:MAG: HDOD domain-containing protein [Pseudomonadota bacterium]|nr:HDOD domain-containing protein [Pseudomonadota bacterium]